MFNNNNKIGVTSSYLLNSFNNINLINLKTNTKVAKFVLFSELLYILIQQSRNYNKLYHQLIFQIEMIKKKLIFNIKDRVIFLSNHKNIKILMLKFKYYKINYDTFIKNIFFPKRSAIFFIYQFIKKNKAFRGDKHLIELCKILQKEVKKNNIYFKYMYLTKLNKYLKNFTINKIRELKIFFFPIFFNFLKKETHRLKLNFIVKNLITTYIFKGINLELSREKLQAVLLKALRISSKFDIRIIPHVDELHLKEKKRIRKDKIDIAMSIKNVSNYILKNNFNFSYLKLLNFLKKNKLESLSFNLLYNLFNNIKLNTLYGFFNSNGIEFNFINKINYNLRDYKNNNINIFEIYKNNSLYYSNSNIHSLINKNFLNTYSIYNFFNSFLKRKKKNFFLSNIEKQIEYISSSYIKYNYYDNILLQIKQNEIVHTRFKNYIVIKQIIKDIKKYKYILTSKERIDNYFLNFYKHKFKKIKGKIRANYQQNTLIYFYKNLLKLYKNKDNKLNKIYYYNKGEYIYKNKKYKKNLNFYKNIIVIKGVIKYLSNYKKISIKKLYKIRKFYKTNILNIINNNSELKLFQNTNININKININSIYQINNNFNFSNELNKYFIYNKFNNIYKIYFTKLKKIINNNKFNIKINTIYKKQNNNINKYNLNNFYKQIINKIGEYKKSKIKNISYIYKFNNKLFSNKIYNFQIKDSKLNFENYKDFLYGNNEKIFSLIFNNSLENINNNINKKIINYNKDNTKNNFNKYIKLFNNNLTIVNNKYNSIKEINLNDHLNLFLNKKINLYTKLLKLSIKNKIFIIKNNFLFTNNKNYNIKLQNNKLDVTDLLTINNFINQKDITKILSKTINYTTTELKKITKFKMKKKKLRKIY